DAKLGVRFECRGYDLDPGEARHPYVAQHEIEPNTGERLERGVPGFSGAHLEAACAQVFRQHEANGVLVVDDENACRNFGLRGEGVLVHGERRHAVRYRQVSGDRSVNANGADQSSTKRTSTSRVTTPLSTPRRRNSRTARRPRSP